jgi:hypothetical protein
MAGKRGCLIVDRDSWREAGRRGGAAFSTVQTETWRHAPPKASAALQAAVLLTAASGVADRPPAWAAQMSCWSQAV